ncbi:MAG: DEAD/DEAH box helicase [Anaerolineae bacterium]
MIRRLFQPFTRRPRTQPLVLSFEVDRDEDDRYVTRVYKDLGGGPELVRDITPLWSYGYREESLDGLGMWVVGEEDYRTLQALRSLNPLAQPDGALVSDSVPPRMLKFMRSRKPVHETPRAQEIQVLDKPLEPAMQIDYQPSKGLNVQAGYRIPGSDTIVPAPDLVATPDREYCRVGKTYIPYPRKLSPAVQQALQTPVRHIAGGQIPEFFLRDLVLYKKEFNAVLTDLAGRIQVINSAPARVVSVQQNQPGWLDFQVNYQVADTTLSHQSILGAKDKYLPLDDFTWVKNPTPDVLRVDRGLQELGAEPTAAGYRVPASQFASLDEFIRDIGGRAELSTSYQQFLSQLTDFKFDERFRLPDSIESHLTQQSISLRPYQRSGIQWLSWLSSNQLHGLLADDMGLGKTLQSICALRMAYEATGSTQHSLILAPKSVLIHWERELQRYFPQANVYLYHGSQRRSSLFQSAKPYIFVTTYTVAGRDSQMLASVPFFYVILDEATQIKNPDTKRTLATKALNSAHRLALSGTPVENRPAELWSVFDFMMRGHLGKYGTFKSTFEDSIAAGDSGATVRLGQRIRPFLLRRLKGDVAADLPPKIELDEWCELTDEQKELYATVQGQAQRLIDSLRAGERIDYTTGILPVLTKLKQICDHPAIITNRDEPVIGRSEKFDWIINKVQEIQASGERVLVFSHFLGMLSLLEKALREKGVRYVRIDGSTNDRQAFVDRFNAGQAEVALCSLMATGQGLTLTAANHVIHADRWWNPAIESQATDRTHRIGQTRTVYVYRILTQDTLEERIDKLLASKRDLADRIIGATKTGQSGWTRDELIELLRPLD